MASGIEMSMLGNITIAQEFYIACGYTDMRKSIDGLAVFVKQRFQMDIYEPVLYLFCGRNCNRMEVLLWGVDGFVLLYKRLENGRPQWPRSEEELKVIIKLAKKGLLC